jgi:hypothetical protein
MRTKRKKVPLTGGTFYFLLFQFEKAYAFRFPKPNMIFITAPGPRLAYINNSNSLTLENALIYQL